MGARQHKLGIVTGKKGVGKSNRTFGTILDINRGNITIGLPPRHVLIIDVNNEYGSFKYFWNPNNPDQFQEYRIKAIAVEHIGWMAEHKVPMVRRLVMLREDGTKMSIDELQEHLYYVLNTFGNGVLMIEDINKYTTSSFSNEMIGAIVGHRHTNLDIIMQYQSIGKVNPTLWQNFNWMRMHKEGDSARRFKDRIPEFHQYLQLAQEIVNKKFKDGDEHAFVYYNPDDMTIKGNFSEAEAREAVMKVISINKNELLKPLLDLMDTKGRKIHTPEQAIKILMDNYMNDTMQPLGKSGMQPLKMAAEKGAKT